MILNEEEKALRENYELQMACRNFCRISADIGVIAAALLNFAESEYRAGRFENGQFCEAFYKQIVKAWSERHPNRFDMGRF